VIHVPSYQTHVICLTHTCGVRQQWTVAVSACNQLSERQINEAIGGDFENMGQVILRLAALYNYDLGELAKLEDKPCSPPPPSEP
jgi:hypothetical protein